MKIYDEKWEATYNVISNETYDKIYDAICREILNASGNTFPNTTFDAVVDVTRIAPMNETWRVIQGLVFTLLEKDIQ